METQRAQAPLALRWLSTFVMSALAATTLHKLLVQQAMMLTIWITVTTLALDGVTAVLWVIPAGKAEDRAGTVRRP